MFGVGESSSSLFGSQQQSAFRKNNNTASSNPFAAPCTPNPFGTQSIFGGNSIPGVFGTSSTLPSTPTFQNTASSAPCLGGSMPSFCIPTPAFGSGSFRGFTTPQPSPFTPSSTPSDTTNTFGTLFSQAASSSPFTPSNTISSFHSANKFGYGNNVPFNSMQFKNGQPCPSSSLFGQTNPSQQSQPAFSFPNFGQQQPAVSSGVLTKADAEDLRALLIRLIELCTSTTSTKESKDTNNIPLHENGKLSEKYSVSCEHCADIEALMPKLRHSDYYTEPTIQELAAKERAEPGYCSRVKDFVVGRHGFGRVKFAGETDVRNLDLESLVQFKSREVTVYLDRVGKD